MLRRFDLQLIQLSVATLEFFSRATPAWIIAANFGLITNKRIFRDWLLHSLTLATCNMAARTLATRILVWWF